MIAFELPELAITLCMTLTDPLPGTPPPNGRSELPLGAVQSGTGQSNRPLWVKMAIRSDHLVWVCSKITYLLQQLSWITRRFSECTTFKALFHHLGIILSLSVGFAFSWSFVGATKYKSALPWTCLVIYRWLVIIIILPCIERKPTLPKPL